MKFSKLFIPFLFLFIISVSAISQDCVTGRVIDSQSKQPLPGVTVKLKSGNLGVSTDMDGRFRICPPASPPFSLEFTHVGYSKYEVAITTWGALSEISLTSSPWPIDQVVVTATLSPQSTREVPAMVSVIDSTHINASPATNVDNFLRTIPNLFVDRSKGVFSKNASVSMRGLDGSNRVLILYDGTPLNKTSYGFINWSLISPDIVEQIEVVHGPSSALFGNNAMAGVINIRTKEPADKKFYGSVGAEAGGFGFKGVKSTLGGTTTLFNQDVRIMASGFWRDGDGYIAEPPEIRDSTNVPLYLTEKGVNIKALIPFSDSTSFYVGTNIYTDKRGAGRAVYLADGSYDAYTTNRLHIGYNGYIQKFKFDIYGFAQREVYDRQNESLNKTGDNYRIYHTDQQSGDVGIWANMSRKIVPNNHLTFGVDVKHGYMEAIDIYRTSTDIIQRNGKVTFGAIFLQDEQTLINKKLRILGGLRLDYATFYDGLLDVQSPTSNTGFASDTTSNFGKNSWYSLNPKLGVRYIPNHWLSTYISVSSGFMPAKLDDLVSSRRISKGFKLANPDLQPEHLVTYEVGGNIKIGSSLKFDAALFYSQGRDFQYFVSTGDSIDAGADDIRPIVMRKNISSVDVYGGEFSVRFTPTKWLYTRANFSFNHSTIKGYDVNPELDVDLTGYGLAEVPQQQASVEVFLLSERIANLGVIWIYTGKQWGDDINSHHIKPWNTLDLRVWKEFNGVKFSMDVFDIFDNPYIDKKGLQSPGRYFLFTLGYSFGVN